LAKPNYQYEKRQRDLAKKQKQEEKRRQKLAAKEAEERGVAPTEDASDDTAAAEATPGNETAPDA